MQQDDPRNIFYNQRRGYCDESETKNNAHPDTSENNNASCSGKQSAEQTYEQKVAEMKRLAAKYQREGEGQLVKDIVNSVIEQKAAGKLSNDQLLAFAKRITPLLNAEQRTRLNGLVEQLLKL